jgi:hypothetical protein
MASTKWFSCFTQIERQTSNNSFRLEHNIEMVSSVFCAFLKIKSKIMMFTIQKNDLEK